MLFPTQTLALDQFFTLASTLASVLGLSGIYTDINFQKAIKLALEVFIKNQEYG